MDTQAELKALLKKHLGFWRCEETDKPLMSVIPYRSLQLPREQEKSILGFKEGDSILPDQITPERYLPALPPSVVSGDFIRGAGLPGVCWTEALLGCPIKMGAGGVWAEPFISSRNELSSFLSENIKTGNPWMNKFEKATAMLAEKTHGTFPVQQPLMRGPADMMASALGHTQMALAFYDYPDEAAAFLDLCTDLFIQMADKHLELAPPFQGGYITYGIWAPGAVIRTQVDNSIVLSPQLYHERYLPNDMRIFSRFPTVVIHIHSSCLHIIDSLLDQPDLNAVQVSIDFPGGPSFHEILPILEKIHRKKPLILSGPVTDAELDLISKTLPPSGMALILRRVLNKEEAYKSPS